MEEFFDEPLPNSKVKSQIVASYFKQWAKVIGKVVTPNFSVNKLAYIDLFSGPGKYQDGTDSTPVLILKHAIETPELQKTLVTLFNDKENTLIETLKAEAQKIEGIEKLKYKPVFVNDEVGSDMAAELRRMSLIPSLVFLDPFGYKALSLELIGSAIKDWGCDCIFFFNYNRINAAITNPAFSDHVNGIFGKDVADKLRSQVGSMSPDEREKILLSTFLKSLKSVNGTYSITFKFLKEDSSKTSHFLILVSKNILAYKLMKEIMAKFSSTVDEIPTYEFNPRQHSVDTTITLFGDNLGRMADFRQELLDFFKGRTLTVEEIFLEHNVGRPYTLKNYKTALLRLEMDGKITCNPSKRKKMNGKLTMGNTVSVTFK